MKFMKLALLGTAALAAVSVSARADDLADLKAQIEALKADVANLQAAPSVPAGYSLMTVGEAQSIVVPTLESNKFEYGATANNIGVLPTADMPASTNIQWSGFVRAALVYEDSDTSNAWGALAGADTSPADVNTDGELHILGRGELKVVGTTDTAVGEVGALVKLRANFDGSSISGVTMPEAWGWWKMTPELTFGGGYTGSLSTINHGADNMTQMYGGGLDAGPYGFGDAAQFRLSYASGPLSAAVAIVHWDDAETHITGDVAPAGAPLTTPTALDGHEEIGAEGEIKYSGDMFSVELAGGVREDNWKAGIGATANLSDMFSIQVSGQIGEDNDGDYNAQRMPGVEATDVSSDYWNVSALIVASLSDSISAELGASYQSLDGSADDAHTNSNYGDISIEEETIGVAAGLYYTPVSQLTLGVEASWNNTETSEVTTAALGGRPLGDWETSETDDVGIAFVSVFRF
jgi:hypothetical protein